MRECPKNKNGDGNMANTAQSSSFVPLKRAAPRGATSGKDRGENHPYAITSCLEQEKSQNVVINMIKVYTYDVYGLLYQ